MTRSLGLEEDIESVFADLDCMAPTKRHDHGGSIAAYVYAHGCADGYWCKAHYDIYVNTGRAMNDRILQSYGHITCSVCKTDFYSIEAFHKVTPL